MKINSYVIRGNESNVGIVYGKIGTQEVEIGSVGDISDATPQTLEERAKVLFKLENVEVGEWTPDEEFFIDQKADLSLVRTCMRNILKNLSNDNVGLRDKKEYLDVYQQMCSSAQAIINTCKVELAIKQTAGNLKKNK